MTSCNWWNIKWNIISGINDFQPQNTRTKELPRMLEGLYIFTTKFPSKQKVSILYVKILGVLRPKYFF